MPGTRYSVFNPDGESYVPETERFALQRRSQAMSEWATQQALAQRSREMDNQLALHGTFDQRTAAERGMMGDKFGYDRELLRDGYAGQYGLADRNNSGALERARLGEDGALARARVANEAPMAQIGLAREAMDREWGAGEATRGVNDRKAMLQSAVYDELLGKGTPGAGGAGMFSSPRIRDTAFLGAIGVDPRMATDPDDALIRQGLASRLAGADPDEVPGILGAIKSGDYASIPTNNRAMIGRRAEEVSNAGGAADIDGTLKRIHQFIRANNWGIGDSNRSELRQMYNEFLGRLDSLGVSPQARSMLESKLKDTMRDALHQNGMFFEAAGSDATRREFNLGG